MSTIARKIDALGGTDPAASADWNAGYADALTEVANAAELADAQIDELIEMVEDMLNGTDLAKWAAYARRTVNGIKAERAR